MLEARGDLDGAQEAYARDIEISQRVARRDPSNVVWQRDLAIAHLNLGKLLEGRGNLDAARAAFVDLINVWQLLTELAPNESRNFIDLAQAHRSLGQVLLKLSNDGWVPAVRTYLKLVGGVAMREPNNPTWQYEAVVARLWAAGS